MNFITSLDALEYVCFVFGWLYIPVCSSYLHIYIRQPNNVVSSHRVAIFILAHVYLLITSWRGITLPQVFLVFYQSFEDKSLLFCYCFTEILQQTKIVINGDAKWFT